MSQIVWSGEKTFTGLVTRNEVFSLKVKATHREETLVGNNWAFPYTERGK